MVWLLAVAMVAGAQTEKKRYVEVCGVKWATGNLYYKNGKYGLFEKQYGTFGAKQQTENQVEHFNWGLTSPDYAGNNYLHKYYGPIGGTEYDIATKCLGKEWRLPTEAELEKLEKEADIAYGYVDTKGGRVYGVLFTTPEGKRKPVKKPKSDADFRPMTDADLDRGLFLPLSGERLASSQFVEGIGNVGLYWSDMVKKDYVRLLALRSRFKPYWLDTVGGVGCSVRPVYRGK